MATVSGGFSNYASGSGSWTSATSILSGQTGEAYITFLSPGGVGYIKLYNWTKRNDIPDGSTINSVLVTVGNAYNKSTDSAPGKFGINFEDTDVSTYRKLTDFLNLGTAADEDIPTTGTGQTPNWWRTGWTSADILEVLKKTSSTGALRLYGIGSTLDDNRLFLDDLSIEVDYTPPTSGGIFLGGF